MPKNENEKPAPAPKKEKYQEPIGQKVGSETVKPSAEAAARVKELEASTPEALAEAAKKKK